MKNLNDYSTNFNSFRVWKILKDLSILPNKKYTVSDLSRLLNLDIHHPYINQLFKYLIKKGIVIPIQQEGRRKYAKINFKKLRILCEESLVWKEFAEYVHKNKILYADI